MGCMHACLPSALPIDSCHRLFRHMLSPMNTLVHLRHASIDQYTLPRQHQTNPYIMSLASCRSIAFAKNSDPPQHAFLVEVPHRPQESFLPHVLIKNVQVDLDFTGAGFKPYVLPGMDDIRFLHGYQPWQVTGAAKCKIHSSTHKTQQLGCGLVAVASGARQ